jgi:hypothetical protein
VIRLHGLPLTVNEASELAAWLRANGDPGGEELADRLERAVPAGMGIIAVDRSQALAVLAVLDEWRPNGERLWELAQELRAYVAEPPSRAA